MIFPFSIKYTKRLKNKVAPDDIDKTMRFIEDFISKKSGEDIKIEGNILTFIKTLSGSTWRTNILEPTEKGEFVLLNTEDNSFLTYEFFMYHLFIMVTLASVFIAAVSYNVWYGIACFTWLGVMNWIIVLIRHYLMFGEIVEGIDSLVLV